MNRSIFSFALLGVFGVHSIVGCAAPSEGDASTDGAETAEDAVSAQAQQSCGRANYDRAFALYKSAVDDSKRFLRGEVCEEGVTIHEIATRAVESTEVCGDFSKVIATSPWAKPLRETLKNNLALAVATGKLAKEGLPASLPGVTFYGPAPGVLGNMSKITFGENGKGTYWWVDFDERGEIVTGEKPMTYSSSAEGDITITIDGDARKYRLVAPDQPTDLRFGLEPVDPSNEVYWSLPSECEA